MFISLFVILAYFFLIAKSVSSRLEAISCDFDEYAENGFCNYRAAPGRNTRDDWSLEPAEVVRETYKFDGPRTGVTNQGNFIKIIKHGSYYGRQDDFEHGLVSPPIRLSGPHCFSLDYYLFGPQQRLTIRANEVGHQSKPKVYLFARTEGSSTVDRWNHYQKTVNFRDMEYEIIIHANSLFYNGTVAIDNLLFTKGRCLETEAVVKSCDFDAVYGSADRLGCDWIEAVDINHDQNAAWNLYLRQIHMYRDYSTGTDHGGFLQSSRRGGAAFSELKFGRFTPADGRHCLSFQIVTWPTAEWNITAVYDNGFEVLIMRTEIDDGGSLLAWTAKYVDIDPIFPMSLTLKVKSGSFLFLDALELRRGRCPHPFACTFEDGPCGYSMTSSLKIGKGRSQNPDSLIPFETSIQNLEYDKNYLYYDGTQQQRGDYHVRVLDSPLNRGGTFCHKLRAKLANGKIDDLQTNRTIEVRLRTGPLWEASTLLDTNYIRQGDDPWIEVLTTVTSKEPFMLRISIAQVNETTILQIRDAMLGEGWCERYQVRNGTFPLSVFPEVNFHCFETGHYIAQYRTCDGVIDCPMGEDEGDHCEGLSCSEAGIICKAKGYHFCLDDVSRCCDGIQDCDDGVEEDPRYCNRDTFCDNYCLNDGECVTSNTKRGCDCEDASGKRCQMIIS